MQPNLIYSLKFFQQQTNIQITGTVFGMAIKRPRRLKRLTQLKLKEISGVDHPANLHEGWAVIKSDDDPIGKAVTTAVEQQPINALENDVGMTDQIDDAEVAVKEEIEVPEHWGESQDQVSKALEDVRKELDEAKAEVTNLRKEAILKDAINDCQRWVGIPELNPDEFAPIVSKLRDSAPEEMEQIAKVLDACAVVLSEADFLKEIGSDAAPETDAYAKIESMAKAMIEDNTVSTLSEGIAKVAVQNPNLYSAYVAEMGA